MTAIPALRLAGEKRERTSNAMTVVPLNPRLRSARGPRLTGTFTTPARNETQWELHAATFSLRLPPSRQATNSSLRLASARCGLNLSLRFAPPRHAPDLSVRFPPPRRVADLCPRLHPPPRHAVDLSRHAPDLSLWFPPPRRGGGLGRGLLRSTRFAALLALFTLGVINISPASSIENAVTVPGGSFESVLPATNETNAVKVATFRLDRTPVTNAQFAHFLSADTRWRRDRVARLFADEQYLRHWHSATAPAPNDAQKPVVHVSWFAASAYCESRGARLATWYEWEYVAAASESKRDARNDPAWRQQILSWYSQSGRGPLPMVGSTPANVYGVRDLHGVVWEWIEDLPALLVANDSREQGDPSEMRFCGAGAISMEQKENYAMLMRIAMLSSMKANYTSATMGFRCATDGGTTR